MNIESDNTLNVTKITLNNFEIIDAMDMGSALLQPTPLLIHQCLYIVDESL